MDWVLPARGFTWRRTRWEAFRPFLRCRSLLPWAVSHGAESREERPAARPVFRLVLTACCGLVVGWESPSTRPGGGGAKLRGGKGPLAARLSNIYVCMLSFPPVDLSDVQFEDNDYFSAHLDV